MPHSPTTIYRLAPSVAARFVGLSLLGLGVLMFLITALVALLNLPPAVLVALLLVGLVAVSGLAWWLRSRAWVVRATAEGYEVRLVRGAGVRSAPWEAVEDAVTTVRHDVPCVELRLSEERSTTLPVGILDVDKEQFVRDLQVRLQAARKLRRYEPPTPSN